MRGLAGTPLEKSGFQASFFTASHQPVWAVLVALLLRQRAEAQLVSERASRIAARALAVVGVPNDT